MGVYIYFLFFVTELVIECKGVWGSVSGRKSGSVYFIYYKWVRY